MIDLEKIAKDRDENPYYLAFAIEHGHKSAKEAFQHFGSNYPFIKWNDERWRETMKRINKKGPRPSHHSEHIKTLQTRLENYHNFCTNRLEILGS